MRIHARACERARPCTHDHAYVQALACVGARIARTPGISKLTYIKLRVYPSIFFFLTVVIAIYHSHGAREGATRTYGRGRGLGQGRQDVSGAARPPP